MQKSATEALLSSYTEDEVALSLRRGRTKPKMGQMSGQVGSDKVTEAEQRLSGVEAML